MDVVRRVQSFARQEAPVSLTRCDLGQLVYEALELTRARWHDAPEKEGRPIRAVRRLGGLPAVLGTQSEIKEAVTNLIFNAVDAMPHGGTITFAGEEVVDDAKRRWVELRVSDTGVGIPEELREKVFDPFFTTKGLHGTGLGLSVVWGIMKRLGGTIRAERVADRGAAFVLRFAVDESGPARTPVLEAREVTTCRILIVDDDRTARRLLRTLLQSAGHSVIEADTVDAALAVIADGRVDLVCTDIRMPGKDGFYLVRALQRGEQRVRVIVVTGFDTDAAEARTMPGIDAVIEKPLDVPTMLKAVTQVLARPAERTP
jgi:CheY-like chemotaxis protein